MVLSIAGTTVIDDSRQLASIANLKTVNGNSLLGSGDISLNRLVNLGTMTTTSGASQSLSSLTLTGYKYLMMAIRGVSHNSASSQQLLLGQSTSDDVIITGAYAGTTFAYGIIMIDLVNGSMSLGGVATTSGGSAVSNALRSEILPIVNASTTISIAISGGAFDAGSVTVYGVG